MFTVLIVEDDKNLRDTVEYNLIKEGYRVLTAGDGASAIEIARADKPDLIILDVLIPEINGFEVCRIIRKESAAPIIIVTARDEEIDRINGLEAGADDYAAKPFGMRELMARVRALLRRSTWTGGKLQVAKKKDESSFSPKKGGVDIDLARHKAYDNGVELHLSPKEFDLLSLLNDKHGIVFSREKIAEKIWGLEYEGTLRTIDVHISSLRQKIENDPEKPTRLVTVRGYGYKFDG